MVNFPNVSIRGQGNKTEYYLLISENHYYIISLTWTMHPDMDIYQIDPVLSSNNAFNARLKYTI